MFVKSALGLRIVGIIKLISAVGLVTAGIGIFHLLGDDISDKFEELVRLVRLDPGNFYINSIFSWLLHVNQNELKAIGLGTFFYALLYSVEGVGLILYKRWAEYLTVIATGFFLPLEIYQVIFKISLLKIAVLVINLLIVIYLVYMLRKQYREAHSNG